MIAWATAQKVRALARAEEAMGEESPGRQENQPLRFGGDEAHALAVAEASTACALSEGTAARLLHDAADLTTSLWQVLEAVEAGEISEAHARVILDQARSLPAEQAESSPRWRCGARGDAAGPAPHSVRAAGLPAAAARVSSSREPHGPEGRCPA